MSDNQRYDYRTPIQIIVDHMQCPGESQGFTCHGHILELSASGCQLESENELYPGQEIMVNFVLAAGLSILNAKVKVLRVLSNKKTRHIVAGHFINLSELDESKIREFVVWHEDQKGKDS